MELANSQPGVPPMMIVKESLEPSRAYLHYRVSGNVGDGVRLHAGDLRGFDLVEHNRVLRFQRSVWTEELASTAICLLTGGVVHTSWDKHPMMIVEDDESAEEGVIQLAAPTEEEIRLINKSHAPEPQTVDSVFTYPRFVVNDKAARNNIIFTKRAIDKFALDFDAGRTRLMHHNSRNMVGRTFKAEVVRKKVKGLTANWVRTTEYMLVAPENEAHIRGIRGGTYGFDSIGFSGGSVELVEEKVGERIVFFLKIDFDEDQMPPLEAVEVSFVFLGAIFGAGPAKGNKLEEGGETPAEVNGDTPVEELYIWT